MVNLTTGHLSRAGLLLHSPWFVLLRAEAANEFLETFPADKFRALLTVVGAATVCITIGGLFYLHMFLGQADRQADRQAGSGVCACVCVGV